jgi:hypothetical protein
LYPDIQISGVIRLAIESLHGVSAAERFIGADGDRLRFAGYLPGKIRKN